MDEEAREWVMQRWWYFGRINTQRDGQWLTLMEHELLTNRKARQHTSMHTSMRPRHFLAAIKHLIVMSKRHPVSYEFRLLNLRTMETLYPTALGL